MTILTILYVVKNQHIKLPETIVWNNVGKYVLYQSIGFMPTTMLEIFLFHVLLFYY